MSQEPLRRPALREMTPAQQAEWYGEQEAELQEFCSYAQAWAKRRAGRGRHNSRDERYEQFFRRSADLIAGLDELRQDAVARHADEREQGNR